MEKLFIKIAKMGIAKATEQIRSISDNSQFKRVKDELEFYLLTVVHAIGDINPRILKYRTTLQLSQEEQDFFLAFVYLNNQLKHDAFLNVIYEEIHGNMYPKCYPYRYGPPGVLWPDFPNNGQRKFAQRIHYDTHLRLKDVLTTLNTMDMLLNKISQQIFAKEVESCDQL